MENGQWPMASGQWLVYGSCVARFRQLTKHSPATTQWHNRLSSPAPGFPDESYCSCACQPWQAPLQDHTGKYLTLLLPNLDHPIVLKSLALPVDSIRCQASRLTVILNIGLPFVGHRDRVLFGLRRGDYEYTLRPIR